MPTTPGRYQLAVGGPDWVGRNRVMVIDTATGECWDYRFIEPTPLRLKGRGYVWISIPRP